MTAAAAETAIAPAARPPETLHIEPVLAWVKSRPPMEIVGQGMPLKRLTYNCVVARFLNEKYGYHWVVSYVSGIQYHLFRTLLNMVDYRPTGAECRLSTPLIEAMENIDEYLLLHREIDARHAAEFLEKALAVVGADEGVTK